MVMLSLQVSDELYKEFEDAREKGGFTSRSEALREAISSFIANQSNLEHLQGYVFCTINITFPIKEEILDELSEINLRNINLIKASTDVRLDDVGLRVYILSGDAKEITDFYKTLSANRHFRVTMTRVIFDQPTEAADSA